MCVSMKIDMAKLLFFVTLNTCILCWGNISTTHWICTQFSQTHFQLKFFSTRHTGTHMQETESLKSAHHYVYNTCD